MSGDRPVVAAVLLAAGAGRRMGGPNKLLAEIDGVSLVRRVAEAALASRAGGVVVVTGHDAEAVAHALTGLPLGFVVNPDHAGGMSTSLRAGIRALEPQVDGALVLLGDMPFVTAAVIDGLVEAFAASKGEAVVAPVHDGRRGNPVLWPRRCFAALMAVEGDKGGRDILAAEGAAVVEVECDSEVGLDLDTPEALAAAGGRPSH